jgi:hypothetical protein
VGGGTQPGVQSVHEISVSTKAKRGGGGCTAECRRADRKVVTVRRSAISRSISPVRAAAGLLTGLCSPGHTDQVSIPSITVPMTNFLPDADLSSHLLRARLLLLRSCRLQNYLAVWAPSRSDLDLNYRSELDLNHVLPHVLSRSCATIRARVTSGARDRVASATPDLLRPRIAQLDTASQFDVRWARLGMNSVNEHDVPQCLCNPQERGREGQGRGHDKTTCKTTRQRTRRSRSSLERVEHDNNNTTFTRSCARYYA